MIATVVWSDSGNNRGHSSKAADILTAAFQFLDAALQTEHPETCAGPVTVTIGKLAWVPDLCFRFSLQAVCDQEVPSLSYCRRELGVDCTRASGLMFGT